MHALIHYEDVRVPAENLLGGEGQAFAIAQTRLGGGRVHHAMRTVAICQRALDLLCERVLSRETQGSLLAKKQFIQGDIADSYAELPAVPPAGALHRLGDRPGARTTGAPARTSPPSRPSPRRCCTTPSGAPCTPTGRWACPTKCPSAACG